MTTKTQKPTDKREQSPVVAWAHANGRIRWSRRYILTAKPIAAELARSRHYKMAVKVWARLAYDNRTALVPGLPERHGDYAALEIYEARVRETILRNEEEKPTRGFTLYEVDPMPAQL